MTGRDLVTAPLRLIGAIAPGESLDAGEATDGLAALNRMIASWSNERMLIPAKVRETFTLSSGTGSYTMGAGADFDTARPTRIEAAAIEDSTSSPAVEYPLRLLSLAQWAELSVKGLESVLPSSLYVQGTFPSLTLNLYPVPASAHNLVIYSEKPLTSIATLDTEVSLPPGYEEALIYNLAIRFGPEYGRPLSAEIVGIASESKANIKRANHQPSYLKVDSALRGPGYFNILTGGPE